MIETFSEEKKRISNGLSKLRMELDKLEKTFELDLDEIRSKVSKGIENIEKEKFSIAFFGAFSDGKSTLISALTQRLDIKIEPDPSTDKIEIYEWGDYILVDTPGPFSEHLMHEEVTKKYIPEANVIIYTVDAVNPLKESHHSVVKWLIKDLAKMNSTIFVLNKIDEVADLEDDEDFKRNCEIKKQVLIDTLKEIVKLEPTTKVRVLCIAADPYGLGLQYWFSNMHDYKRLSRIDNLLKELKSFINLAKEDLIIKAGISIIKDSIEKTIDQLKKLEQGIEEQDKILDRQIEELDRRLTIFEKDINRNYTNIKNKIINMRKDLLQSIEACADVSVLRKKIKEEIGNNGYILNEKINLIIQEDTENLYEEQKKYLKNVENSLEFYSEIQDKLVKSFAQVGSKFGEKILQQSTRSLANKVLEVRDISKLPIKFKPWGAIKWAKRIEAFGKFLKALPVVTESINFLKTFYDEHKLNNEKKKISKEIEDLFKKFLEEFTLDEYKKTYFPSVAEMFKLRDELLKLKKNNIEILVKIEKSKSELEKLMIFEK